MYFTPETLAAAARELVSTARAALRDVPWRVGTDGANTYEELRSQWEQGCLVVQPDHAGLVSVYDGPADNAAMRAWHDYHHVQGGHPFTPEGELATVLSQLAAAPGLSRDARRLLWIEVVGQVSYLQATGKYVVDQRAFTLGYTGPVPD